MTARVPSSAPGLNPSQVSPPRGLRVNILCLSEKFFPTAGKQKTFILHWDLPPAPHTISTPEALHPALLASTLYNKQVV